MATADQQRLILFASILCAGVSYWFYVNLEVEPNHIWDPLLVDPRSRSGGRREPREVLQLTKIINYTREYIESTNAEERLYDLKYQLDFEKPTVTEQHYSYPEDELVSGWPVADQTLCGAQLAWILTRLSEHAHYTFLRGQLGFELTNLMDSFGRPEANTYAGVVSWLGSYERCLGTSLDGGNIKTRYCEARMRPKWWPKDDEAPVIPPTRIRLGVCLPETCDTLSLKSHRPAIERLAKFQLPELYKGGLDLVDLFCLPDERSPIRQLPLSGRIFLVVVSSWLVLVLAGTIVYECRIGRKRHEKKRSAASVDLQHQNETAATTVEPSEPTNEEDSHALSTSLWWELVESLSLRCSLEAFTSNTFRVRQRPGQRIRVDLSFLDFFKINLHMLMVLGHSALLSQYNMRNLTYRIDYNTNQWTTRAGLSLARFVDTFYVFFGVLATYSLMHKFNASQLANPIVWLGFNLRTFMRVAPLFMLVYWYSRSVSPYTGAGPWWDYGVDELSMKGLCLRESWFQSIPYLGRWDPNYPAPTCNPPSWFIISYLEIATLLPLITYLLCRLPHSALRLCLVSFLSVCSAVIIGVRMHKQTSVTGEGFTLYGALVLTLMEKFQSTGYMTAIGRLCSVSIGCFVGYLLRHYELGSIPGWPKWFLSSRLFILANLAAHLTMFLLPIFGHMSYLYTGRLATMNQIVIGTTVAHVVWPVLNGLFILQLATNQNHQLAWFFGHSFWHSASRLGFCIYLINWELISWTVTGYEQATPYGFRSEIFRIWSFVSLQSIVLAFFIHLLFETPFSRLTTIMTRPLLGAERRAAKEEEEAAEDDAPATVRRLPTSNSVSRGMTAKQRKNASTNRL